MKNTHSSRRTRTKRIGGYVVCGILALCTALPALAVEPGSDAPQIDGPRLDGKGNVALSDYRGKVVYVDFWASWCGPCLSAVPALEEMRNQIPERDFQILAVNLDKQPAKARKFLDKFKVGYPSVSDPKGAFPASYGLETMPTSYLIDRDGVVRYVHKGFRKDDMEQIKHEVKRWVRR